MARIKFDVITDKYCSTFALLSFSFRFFFFHFIFFINFLFLIFFIFSSFLVIIRLLFHSIFSFFSLFFSIYIYISAIDLSLSHSTSQVFSLTTFHSYVRFAFRFGRLNDGKKISNYEYQTLTYFER